MDLDSLIQLIVLIGAGLAWLLGGGRKPRSQDRLPPDVRPTGRAGTRRRPQHARPRAVPTTGQRPEDRIQATERPEAAAPRREATLEDLYRILTGEPVGGPVLQELPPADVGPPTTGAEPLERIPEVEARSLESVEPIAEARPHPSGTVEPRSLEALEPAGAATHERFHELYIAAPQPSRKPVRRLRLGLRLSSVREGILWREVLGPPKGLR